VKQVSFRPPPCTRAFSLIPLFRGYRPQFERLSSFSEDTVRLLCSTHSFSLPFDHRHPRKSFVVRSFVPSSPSFARRALFLHCVAPFYALISFKSFPSLSNILFAFPARDAFPLPLTDDTFLSGITRGSPIQLHGK